MVKNSADPTDGKFENLQQIQHTGSAFSKIISMDTSAWSIKTTSLLRLWIINRPSPFKHEGLFKTNKPEINCKPDKGLCDFLTK